MPHGAAALRFGGPALSLSVNAPVVEALPKATPVTASSPARGGMERLGQVLFGGVAIAVLLVGAKDEEYGFRLQWTACVVLHVALTALLYALLVLTAEPLRPRWMSRTVDLSIGILLAGATLMFAGDGGTNDATGAPVPELRAGVFLLLVLAVDFMAPDRLRAIACGSSGIVARDGTEATILETVAVEDDIVDEPAVSRSLPSMVLQYVQVLLSVILTVVSWLALTTTSNGSIVMVHESRCAVLLGVYVVLFYAVVRCLGAWNFSLQVSLIADSVVIVFLIARSIVGTYDSSFGFSAHLGVVFALLNAITLLLLATLEFRTARRDVATPATVPTVFSHNEEPEVRVPLAIVVSGDDHPLFAPLVTPGLQNETGNVNANRMT